MQIAPLLAAVRGVARAARFVEKGAIYPRLDFPEGPIFFTASHLSKALEILARTGTKTINIGVTAFNKGMTILDTANLDKVVVVMPRTGPNPKLPIFAPLYTTLYTQGLKWAKNEESLI